MALLAMALSGHVAALSLIDAPPFAVYQHYRPWSGLLRGSPPLGVFVLAIQAFVCLWLGYRTRQELLRGARRIAPRWYLLLAAGLLAFSAAVPTESVDRFIGELLLSCGVMAVAGLNLLFVVRALPGEALRRIQSRLASGLTVSHADGVRPWDRRMPLLAATWVLVVSSGLAFLVFDRVPHIDDGICYLFQAKYMSVGDLWLPRPPDPESFGVAYLIVDGDKWYGKFFPGWPAVLSVGVAAGVPWLVNPLLGALSILLTHNLIRRVYDLRTAHAVTLLISASPWLLFMSASFMAHTASLFWTLLALVAIDHQRGRPAGAWAPVAGISLGMLFLTRPFDAALVGPVAGLWALGLGARRLSIGTLAVAGGTTALLAGLYFVYNAALTGDPFLAPHRLWADRVFGPGTDVLGFGPNIGIPLWSNVDPLPGHGLADVVLNANKNFSLTNFELFGWAFGSLALACVGMQPRGIHRRDGLIAGILLAIIVGHAFWWFPGGPDFGARLWYLVIVPFTVLTVRGTEVVVAGLAEPGADRRSVAGRAVAFLTLASVSAFLAVIPWRSVTKYDHYRGIGREFQEIANRYAIKDALVFVRSSSRSDYQAAFNFNPPTLDSNGNIFVRELGSDHVAAILRHYSTRVIWVVGRESEIDEAIDMIAGPLPPGTKPPGPALEPADSLQAFVR